MNIRCFVGIPMPDHVLDDLARLTGGLPGARWIEEEDIHLTLRFIGEVDGLVFRDVAGALDEIRLAPFELSLNGMGFFPPRGEPRVLWAGTSNSEPLSALKRRVDREVNAHGGEQERRKWIPHVTLARLSGTPSSRLARYLGGNSLFRTPPFVVDRFNLYTSRLHHSGATYTVESTYLLDQGS
ncbi:MAG: RNA 2',3'-cyclic phosphodiesterase [Myxococcota bacterium]|nr:RNA 2',3'-cyclic phosphodiesterase [Myxococcota bacterium]MEE2778993.1 RNA 2',3'-cyclic phosphodiesterase [Myxococcota bacterium]